MKDLFLRITSLILVAALAIGSTPFSLHHEHETETHCDHSEDLSGVNACHVSIYHAENHEDISCEHKFHVNEDENDCEWCSILAPKRHKYSLPRLQAFEQSIELGAVDFSHLGFIQTTSVSLKPGRAPPVLS